MAVFGRYLWVRCKEMLKYDKCSEESATWATILIIILNVIKL